MRAGVFIFSFVCLTLLLRAAWLQQTAVTLLLTPASSGDLVVRAASVFQAAPTPKRKRQREAVRVPRTQAVPNDAAAHPETEAVMPAVTLQSLTETCSEEGKALVHNTMAEQYYLRGHYNVALMYLKRALSTEADCLITYFNLGLVYDDKFDFGRAQHYYEELLRDAPQYAPAYNNLGLVYFKRSLVGAARSAFREAVTLAPQYVSAELNLGNTYYVSYYYDVAEEHYLAAYARAPQVALISYNLGLVYFNKGDYAQAITAFARVVELAPAFIEGYYQLGLTHDALGRMALEREQAEAAREQFSLALAVYAQVLAAAAAEGDVRGRAYRVGIGFLAFIPQTAAERVLAPEMAALTGVKAVGTSTEEDGALLRRAIFLQSRHLPVVKKHAAVTYYLALSYVADAMIPAALSLFKRVLELDQRYYDKIIEQLSKLAEQEVAIAELYYLLAEHYYTVERNEDQALLHLEKALDLQHDHRAARVLLLRLAQARGITGDVLQTDAEQ